MALAATAGPAASRALVVAAARGAGRRGAAAARGAGEVASPGAVEAGRQAFPASLVPAARPQRVRVARSLEAVSPLATVARGYSILQHADGRIVRSVEQAAIGDALDARVSDGHLRVRVEGKS